MKECRIKNCIRHSSSLCCLLFCVPTTDQLYTYNKKRMRFLYSESGCVCIYLFNVLYESLLLFSRRVLRLLCRLSACSQKTNTADVRKNRNVTDATLAHS